jgi:uncharacterized membrane protein YkoI
MKIIHAFTLLLMTSTPLAAAVMESPSTTSKTMLAIIEQLEAKQYGPFMEVSWDDGRWEIEVYKKNEPVELSVDGETGEIKSEFHDEAEPRPPQNAKPLSDILKQLQQYGDIRIHEVSFECHYWEIEIFRNEFKYEMIIDPITGNIISDRLDD